MKELAVRMELLWTNYQLLPFVKNLFGYADKYKIDGLSKCAWAIYKRDCQTY